MNGSKNPDILMSALKQYGVEYEPQIINKEAK